MSRNERRLQALAKSLDPTGRPKSPAARVTTSNARVNGAFDKIRAVKAGISAKRGRHDIFVDPKPSGIASLNHNCESHSRVEVIELVTMADVDGIVPAEGEILVKIDVEGHEEVVIRQLVTTGVYHARRPPPESPGGGACLVGAGRSHTRPGCPVLGSRGTRDRCGR
jgi:FkbM family methyltransferase